MKNQELIEYLEKECGKKVYFKPKFYDSIFTLKKELFVDEEEVGVFGNPEEMYLDILYMFGPSQCNDFYQDAIKPCQFKLPSEFKSVEEFANNEIKTLFREVIQQHYKKLSKKNLIIRKECGLEIKELENTSVYPQQRQSIK